MSNLICYFKDEASDNQILANKSINWYRVIPINLIICSSKDIGPIANRLPKTASDDNPTTSNNHQTKFTGILLHFTYTARRILQKKNRQVLTSILFPLKVFSFQQIARLPNASMDLRNWQQSPQPLKLETYRGGSIRRKPEDQINVTGFFNISCWINRE